MSASENPFRYGRPVEREQELVGRERELQALTADARVGQAVMLHAPRRYGKTSLARVLAGRLLRDHETPSVYADFWGVTSLSDVVAVLGRAYSAASGAERMRRYLTDLLRSLGFVVSLGGGVSLQRGAATGSTDDRAALRELLEAPRRMASRAPSGRLLVVLDEFGELFNVPGEPDALMRGAFQASPEVSFLFMGSKRSLMDALFVDRRRPFYNFGRRMELGRLPSEELGEFVERGFRGAGRSIAPEAVDLLLRLVAGHPHRAQQLAYHTFELAPAGRRADEETVLAAKDAALDEATPEFRAILDGMTPAQRAVYVALCREPTTELHSRSYQSRHGIRGSGSLRSALQSLTDSGDVERPRAGPPVPTDPLLAIWVRERLNGG